LARAAQRKFGVANQLNPPFDRADNGIVEPVLLATAGKAGSKAAQAPRSDSRKLYNKHMLAWSEDFATGSPLVDMQHRMLIERINQLEKLLGGPLPAKAVCDDLLHFLETYVGTHFRYEEQCMEKARCPAHEKNKQAHAAFLGVFAKFKERYQAEGPKPELLKGLQTTASDWIKNHILTIDIQLKPCAKPPHAAGAR